MTNTQRFNQLPTMPDLTRFEKGGIKDQVDKVKVIHDDAVACLDILKANVKNYVDYAVNVFDCIINGMITNLSDSAFVILDGSFGLLSTQFECLYHRYDDIDNSGYADAFVRCELKAIDFDNALGIYNQERNGNNPNVIKEDAKFVAAAKTACDTIASSPNDKLQEMAAMKAFYDALSTPTDGRRDDFSPKTNTNPTKQEKADTGRFTLVKSNTKFKDIAGLHEVKEDLEQYIDMIKRPDIYVQFGAKLPKGILLYGPPGTGKTLLARGVAGEAGVNFIALSSTDFTASRWGEVPQMIKELREVAVKNKPCIVFIDEIDMLGMNRGADKANSLAHREGLNAFLSMLDGFETYEGVMFIAATNRLEDIDPAMIRGGRFENQFSVPLPSDIDSVEEVVKIYTKNKRFEENFTSLKMARKLLGHSPASIESILNKACFVAIKNNNGIIREKDFNVALTQQIIKGHIKPVDLEAKDTKITAIHEAGHALVAALKGISVRDVSVLPTTSGAGGLTTFEPTNNHYYKKSDYENKIMVAYAGRAAEQLAYGVNNITTGASADIKQATQLIKTAASYYGFDLCDNKSHAPIVYTTIKQNNLEKAANKYYAETVDVLKDNYKILYDIAKALLEMGTISGDVVNEIIKKHKNSDVNMEVR